MKSIYVIRHCEAEGQARHARLTERGFIQAEKLVDVLSLIPIERIISSPFLRAIQTIEPLAKHKKIEIEQDERLAERILSENPLSNWLDVYKETYHNIDLKFPGGESTREATERVLDLLNDMRQAPEEHIVLVSHGNLISLLLCSLFPDMDGYEIWENLRNPDIIQLQFDRNRVNFEHIEDGLAFL